MGLTYCTHIFAKKLIVTDNLEIANVVLTILTSLETNGITVDLDVLPEAIIERKYFKGQGPVSCFLRKMFRVLNVIYFFITKILKFKISIKVKMNDLKIICYIVVTFSF